MTHRTAAHRDQLTDSENSQGGGRPRETGPSEPENPFRYKQAQQNGTNCERKPQQSAAPCQFAKAHMVTCVGQFSKTRRQNGIQNEQNYSDKHGELPSRLEQPHIRIAQEITGYPNPQYADQEVGNATGKEGRG